MVVLKTTGVYYIQNLVNNKMYVGSAAVSIKRRCRIHRTELRGNRHANGHLQAAWNKYGEESFKFEVIEYCLPANCISREQYWIDILNVCDRNYGYNISPTAGSQLGFTHTDDVKEVLSEYSKEYWRNLSEEERERISTDRKGRVISDETRVKLSNASSGRKHREETKIKMSKSKKEAGYKNKTEEHREKLRQAWVKRKQRGKSEKEILGDIKKGEALRGKTRPPEIGKKISAALKGKPKSEETKAKISATLSGRKLPEEHKKNISKGLGNI